MRGIYTRTSMKVLEAFSSVLRKKRVTAGLTQAELAVVSGLHLNFIGRMEGGKAQPTLESLFALARALDCFPQSLVEDTLELTTSKRRAPRPDLAKKVVKVRPGRPKKTDV